MTMTVGNRTDEALAEDFDDLTCLPGRRAAERAIASAQGAKAPAAFVLFGIDNFRHLNASRGVETGDRILQAVASAFASVLPEGTAFRVSGDGFGALLAGDVAQAETMTARILGAVRSQRLAVDGQDVRITMSAGIVAVIGGATPRALVLDADVAMTAAKAAGRDRAVVFSPAVLRPLAHAAEWADAMRASLDGEGDGFILHAQPVRSTSSDAVQYELLLRLRQDGGQLLAPDEFLPIAARFGLAEAVDAWVLGEAVELVRTAAAKGRRLDLELNVSARSLTSEAFCQHAADRVRDAGIDGSCLIFEVSENDFEGDTHELRHWSSQLRSLGCRFALDNFGSERASLAHLKHLPIDLVKIDGAFIRHLPDEPVDQRIVRSIIELAHGLGQQVVAVHVGDEETLELVRGYGADFVQGFHVGRPVPLKELS